MSQMKPFSPSEFTLEGIKGLPEPVDIDELHRRVIERRFVAIEHFLASNHADLSRHMLVQWPPIYEEFGAPTERFMLIPNDAEIPCSFEEAAKLYPSLSLKLWK